MSTSLATTALSIGTGPVAAQGGNCQSGVINPWGGEVRDVGAWANGVYSTIDTGGATHFYPCDTEGLLNGNSTSAWVSLDPGEDNPDGDEWAILQVGILDCNSGLYPVCNKGVRYFWARAGCVANMPTAHDLGAATYAAHNYGLVQVGSNYLLQVDGVTKVTIAKTNQYIVCWTDKDLRATWFAERWDRGDSTGSNGNDSQRLRISNMGYRVDTSTVWKTPSINSCVNTAPSGTGRYVCAWGNLTNWLHVWTIY